jgi:hypothetical protein
VLLLITDVLWPILEVIDSTVKRLLTLHFNDLAQAHTVQERGDRVKIIEIFLSAALREGSTATIDEVIALVAQHERLGQERDGVRISANNVTGFDGTASLMQIDTAGEDGGSVNSAISVATDGSHGATELGQDGGQVFTAPSELASYQSMTNVESHNPSSIGSDGSGQSAISMSVTIEESDLTRHIELGQDDGQVSTAPSEVASYQSMTNVDPSSTVGASSVQSAMSTSSVTIEESDQARHIELGHDGGQVSSSTPSEVTDSMTDVNCAMSISSDATDASDHSLSDAA